jgi:hypothetical protein
MSKRLAKRNTFALPEVSTACSLLRPLPALSLI